MQKEILSPFWPSGQYGCHSEEPPFVKIIYDKNKQLALSLSRAIIVIVAAKHFNHFTISDTLDEINNIALDGFRVASDDFNEEARDFVINNKHDLYGVALIEISKLLKKNDKLELCVGVFSE